MFVSPVCLKMDVQRTSQHMSHTVGKAATRLPKHPAAITENVLHRTKPTTFAPVAMQ
jgi:hypothetical protein